MINKLKIQVTPPKIEKLNSNTCLTIVQLPFLQKDSGVSVKNKDGFTSSGKSRSSLSK